MKSNQAATGLALRRPRLRPDRGAALLLPDGRDRIPGLASVRARYYCPDCLTSRGARRRGVGRLRLREVRAGLRSELGRRRRRRGRSSVCAFCAQPHVLSPEGLRPAARLPHHGDLARRRRWSSDGSSAGSGSRPCCSSTVVVDWIVATRIRPVTICYRCDAEYRELPVHTAAQGLRSPRRRALRGGEDRAADAVKIFDISRRISEETPVWPGDVPFSWRETHGTGAGAPWGATCFTMSAHCGTHADAPSHVFADGMAIGEAPAGRVHRAGAGRRSFRGSGEVGPDALPRKCLRRAAGALSERREGVAVAARGHPAGRGGGDARRDRRASIDPEDAEDLPAHRALLSRGVALLEDLDLAVVPTGTTSSWPCRCASGTSTPRPSGRS